ncbi:LacI family DNA-binding transcriptional regulator [Litoribacter alkaliphilus]|uniref:LacI family DNA-binding transcriptional regulator n=1 Tax=Litoribacter ruber TaxID=702568 RepID=A0AAP2G3T0_9BACT|nr:LacI family DNA-binding transcriptional regulator [Litoribacter alkaliphilus]MBS9522773.1 LacI family DNA-binding transcriptional regulator [Litoribacter alkaliphilus]
MSAINIKHLAELLKLSPSTVSRALNDSFEISDGTKKRVKALAKELGYQPNPYARSLRGQKSTTIAVIIPERVNNFFGQVIEGIEDVTQPHGYHLLVYNSQEDVEVEKTIVSNLINGRVDAIVMSVTNQTSNFDHLNRIHASGVPLVFFDRVCAEIPTTKFITNDYESAYLGTKQLIESGCSKIVFLVLSKEVSTGKERLRGYLDALKDGGLTFEENWILTCSEKEDENIERISEVLAEGYSGLGILASIEKLAVSTYYAVRKVGIKMPDQVKVISFSNMKFPEILDPPLSIISQPAYEIGSSCAKILMDHLLSDKPQTLEDKTVTLPSKLSIRKSSGN